jgi:DNA polymerase
MPYYGRGEKGVLIIGEAPGEQEDTRNRPFVGKSGQHLRDTLRSFHVDMDRDCWVTNALICRPKNNRTPSPKEIDYCRPTVIKTIKDLKPNTIVILGKTPLRSVIGWIWKKDTGKMFRWVGWHIPCQNLNTWICPTWHPAAMEYEKDIQKRTLQDRLFTKHLRQAFRHKSRPWETVPDYRKEVNLIYDSDEAGKRIKEFIGDHPIAFDYETNMLKPDSNEAKILCCSLSDGKDTIAYSWDKTTKIATGELLKSGTPMMAHNAKFEDRWTRKAFGFGVRNWRWDSMVAAHVLDNRPKITGLKFQSFVRLGQGSYNDPVQPYMESGGNNIPNELHDVPVATLLEYCALDSLLEYKLAMIQMGEMK